MAHAQGLIVNEASNGPSGSKEFYEYMVVGSVANPTGDLDLSDWIIDDNNGEWEGSTTGVGISPGYARFDTVTDAANCSALSAVAPGSIIVIYNGNDPNPNLPADDSTDANGDGVFVLDALGSCIKTCGAPPDTSDTGYSSCAVPSAPSYTPLTLRNSGDVIQARDPSASLFHGFTYGDIKAPYPAGSFKVAPGNGSKKAYVFDCGSWFDDANFSKTNASNETPGAVNDADNAILRSRIQAGSFDYSNLANPNNCIAGTSSLDAAKTVSIWDPDGDGLYAVPGNDVVYSITITNTGDLAADADSLFLVDAMPADVEFYNDDIDDSGPLSDPVIGIDNGTGLTLNYPADVKFSNAAVKPADESECGYAPAVGTYDPAVTFICLSPKGLMLAGDPDPDFEIRFRARIQ